MWYFPTYFDINCVHIFQNFECHRLILSVASDVFQAMLYGNFKEGKMGPDRPIPLVNVDPQVFDCAMR
jgi:BTB/POZ domain